MKENKKPTKKVEVKKDELKAPLYDKEGKVISEIKLPKEIFGQKVNDKLLAQAVRVYTTNKKPKTASTKARSEVSGGGKKPWRQKGTGRARAGTIRSPLWKGGGVVFGPQPITQEVAFPKKMKKKALSMALSQKFRQQDIVFVDKLDFTKAKTKEALKVISQLPIKEKKRLSLIINSESIETIKSFSNLENLMILRSVDLNALDVLKSSGLIFTASGLKELEKRFESNASN